MRRLHSTASIIAWLVALLFPLAFGFAATPQQIDESIRKGKEFLYSAMNGGTWEQRQSSEALPPSPSGDQMFSNDSVQWGMPTATATFALLAAGESPLEPRLASAIEFLKKADIRGIYALGMRCQVWSLLPPSPGVKAAMQRDFHLLMNGAQSGTRNAGLFDFACPPFDKQGVLHETAGYGMLGVKALADAGAEVPDAYWRFADRTWRSQQNKDGGWGYGEHDASVQSASGAGVMSLFVTDQYLNEDFGQNCAGNFKDPARDQGLQFISKLTLNDSTELHWLYMIQRIASASALKSFGTMDWFSVMSDLLMHRQGDDGAWVDTIHGQPQWSDKIVGTGYCIAILSFGRAPLLANKLSYEKTAEKGGDAAGNKSGHWDERPRDIANVADWVGREMEKRLSWRITTLSSPVSDLAQAPLLYIAGNEPIAFNSEELNKLRDYIKQGGVIVGNADCGSTKFAASFRKLGTTLFPDSAFRQLPVDHPLFRQQQFPLDGKRAQAGLEAIGNQDREWMILFYTADPAKAWQQYRAAGKETSFQLMANLYQYASSLMKPGKPPVSN